MLSVLMSGEDVFTLRSAGQPECGAEVRKSEHTSLLPECDAILWGMTSDVRSQFRHALLSESFIRIFAHISRELNDGTKLACLQKAVKPSERQGFPLLQTTGPI